ncbi:rubrerythrin [Oxobacter pfennigii]|uniref:Rubrerythrin n=1 Tax=Oxobacter pfennigii TaxID=36849 RepID=A0A0N8NTR1_9CLOT|nr:ferritin family protein [Oxobacter pfennigii]KPU45536.1 rubrerythrin [Oxobacter pfennigii]
MEEILKAIKDAIKAERQAQEHYQMLADKSEDLTVKGFFEQLVRDEEEHENLLRLRYESLSKAWNKI